MATNGHTNGDVSYSLDFKVGPQDRRRSDDADPKLQEFKNVINGRLQGTKQTRT